MGLRNARRRRPKGKKPNRWGGCVRKKSYVTKRAAIAASNKYENQGLGKQWAYKCTFCDRWHLTSMDKREIQRAVKR